MIASAATGPPRTVTAILSRLPEDYERALDELAALVFGDLRELARGLLRGERSNHTLSATDVVGEACVRLLRRRPLFRNRRHFFAVLRLDMHAVLVDHARRRRVRMRAAGEHDLAAGDMPAHDRDTTLDRLALEDALARLQIEDPELARLAVMRVMGRSVSETAEALGVCERTVERRWRSAEARLVRDLADGPTTEP